MGNASHQTVVDGEQKEVFRSIHQQAYLSLLRTTTELSRQIDELLRTFDISQPQYNVLRILGGAGPKGLGRNEIASRMITTTPDMTRLLNRMVAKGWIVRERDTVDRREIPNRLTTQGQTLLQQIDAPLEQLHTQQFHGLSKEVLQPLLDTLQQIRSHREE